VNGLRNYSYNSSSFKKLIELMHFYCGVRVRTVKSVFRAEQFHHITPSLLIGTRLKMMLSDVMLRGWPLADINQQNAVPESSGLFSVGVASAT
jgi:hypothetical protein